MITRFTCQFVWDNPDPEYIMSSHWNGRFENVVDTLPVNFKDNFVGHIRNPFEARWRMMG